MNAEYGSHSSTTTGSGADTSMVRTLDDVGTTSSVRLGVSSSVSSVVDARTTSGASTVVSHVDATSRNTGVSTSSSTPADTNTDDDIIVNDGATAELATSSSHASPTPPASSSRNASSTTSSPKIIRNSRSNAASRSTALPDAGTNGASASSISRRMRMACASDVRTSARALGCTFVVSARRANDCAPPWPLSPPPPPSRAADAAVVIVRRSSTRVDRRPWRR